MSLAFAPFGPNFYSTAAWDLRHTETVKFTNFFFVLFLFFPLFWLSGQTNSTVNHQKWIFFCCIVDRETGECWKCFRMIFMWSHSGSSDEKYDLYLYKQFNLIICPDKEVWLASSILCLDFEILLHVFSLLRLWHQIHKHHRHHTVTDHRCHCLFLRLVERFQIHPAQFEKS